MSALSSSITQTPRSMPLPAPSPAPAVSGQPMGGALPSYKASAASSSGARAKWQKLVLTTTSLRNVVLANASDVIYYEVVTPKWARGSTTISRLDPNTHQFDIIGEMHNDEQGKAAQVRLYGGALKSVKEFLQGDKESGSEKVASLHRHASFVGKDGKRYTWKVGRKHLELLREDLPADQPVAVYHREKRYMHVLRMSRQPYIEITPAAMDTLDSLILSFLLFERRRRDRKV
ncbi:hypothetical protein EIP86_010930 [Pleurotus ostreatoroseus]|nr:hypothetical protein EIP86_010930 [Pleurotus ostreatoroseus]